MNDQTSPSYQPVYQDRPSPLRNFAVELAFWGLVIATLSLISSVISGVVGLFLWVILYQTTSVGFWGYWQVCFFVILLGEIILFYSFLNDFERKRGQEEREDRDATPP